MKTREELTSRVSLYSQSDITAALFRDTTKNFIMMLIKAIFTENIEHDNAEKARLARA